MVEEMQFREENRPASGSVEIVVIGRTQIGSEEKKTRRGETYQRCMSC